MMVSTVSADRARDLFTYPLSGYSTKFSFTMLCYLDTTLNAMHHHESVNESEYTLINDFNSGISLQEAKQLPRPDIKDIDNIPISLDRYSTIVFGKFVVNVTVSGVSDVSGVTGYARYGYIQDNIRIPYMGFREHPIMPMIINHAKEDGWYRKQIHEHCIAVFYIKSGLCQGYSCNINPENNEVIGTSFYHNGLLISQNDNIFYANRRVTRVISNNEEINYLDGRLHGPFITPEIKAIFEYDYFKGQIAYTVIMPHRFSSKVTFYATFRFPIQRLNSHNNKWLDNLITDTSRMIGKYTICKENGVVIYQTNLDPEGCIHGLEIKDGEELWYWHSQPLLNHDQFKSLYNQSVKIIVDSSELPDVLSDLVAQYLHQF